MSPTKKKLRLAMILCLPLIGFLSAAPAVLVACLFASALLCCPIYKKTFDQP